GMMGGADYFVETLQLALANVEPVESGFDETNVLPSAALTIFLRDDLQLRGAFGRTVSRPLFNELSPSLFFDPDSGQQFLGNANLVQTEIDGFDLRAEWYPSTTESATLGVFRKDYTNPLERTFLPDSGGAFTATFQNADEAVVTGVEFGGRLELGRLRGWFGGPALLDSIYLSANAAVLDSEVTLADQQAATSRVRPLEGQADLVINLQIGLDTDDHDFTVAFNRVGERLRQVGVFNQPDVLQAPLDVLDVNYTWSIDDAWTLKVSGSNLLNATVRLTQQLDGQEAVIWREFQRGRGLGLGISYAL
ncbi:MAG: TonB-dependent receptor, partial [Myxococcota bacterium]